MEPPSPPRRDQTEELVIRLELPATLAREHSACLEAAVRAVVDALLSGSRRTTCPECGRPIRAVVRRRRPRGRPGPAAGGA